MTAFLMHDLKTVLSQLSLLVENGRIHKNNPDFVDDMLNTVEHVNSKMQRLVQQLRDPKRTPRSEPNNLAAAVQDVLSGLNVTDVTISVDNRLNADVEIDCNRENLISAIKHIVQNAVESCDRDGRVDIILTHESEGKVLLRIIDNGKGMSREFIAERLFQPFDSTKGVTGMGVGVYQSRTFFRSIGGDISVHSDPGKGSTFLISIPVGND
jgi:putative PEP-CTERM system histidine kinase